MSFLIYKVYKRPKLRNWRFKKLDILSISITVGKYIYESSKTKRIEKFKDMDNSKIEVIGNYEKKATFWDKYK